MVIGMRRVISGNFWSNNALRRNTMKINVSARINRNFANEVSRFSIESGIELHVARNILRFRRALRTQPKKVWTDPKTGLALTQAQWESPSQKLYRKATMGTGATIENPNYPDVDFKTNNSPLDTWRDAVDRGMFYASKSGVNVLMTKEQADALLAQYGQEFVNPFDHEPAIVTESVFEAQSE